MEQVLARFMALYGPAGYAVIFFGMMIEGDALLFLVSFLVQRGVLELWFALAAAWLGLLAGDVAWYRLGIFLESRGERDMFARIAKKISAPFARMLRERPGFTLFLSKFLYGANHAIIVRAGMIGVERSSFYRYNTRAAFFWFAVIWGLGYFSGISFSALEHRLEFVEFALVGGIIGIYALEFSLKRVYGDRSS